MVGAYVLLVFLSLVESIKLRPNVHDMLLVTMIVWSGVCYCFHKVTSYLILPKDDKDASLPLVLEATLIIVFCFLVLYMAFGLDASDARSKIAIVVPYVWIGVLMYQLARNVLGRSEMSLHKKTKKTGGQGPSKNLLRTAMLVTMFTLIAFPVAYYMIVTNAGLACDLIDLYGVTSILLIGSVGAMGTDIDGLLNNRFRLTALLLLFCLSVFAVFSVYVNRTGAVLQFFQKFELQSDYGLIFTPDSSGGVLVDKHQSVALSTEGHTMLKFPDSEGVKYMLSRPIKYFDRNIKSLDVHKNGIVYLLDDNDSAGPRYNGSCTMHGLYLAPFCVTNPEQYRVFVQNKDQHIVVTWLGVNSSPHSSRAFQLVLHETGRFEFNYSPTPIFEILARIHSLVPCGLIGFSNGGSLAQNVLQLSPLVSFPLYSTSGSLLIDAATPFRATLHKITMYRVEIQTFVLLAIALPVFLFIPRLLTELANKRSDYQNEEFVKFRFNMLPKVPSGVLEKLEKAGFYGGSSGPFDIMPSDKQAGQTDDRKTMLSKDEAFILRAINNIEENISEFEFNVEVLAETMCLSPRQLHRKIQKLTGKTPANLIRDYRLQYANTLLEAKAVNVTEAAYSVGFKDIGHFSKLYEQKYGKTPMAVLKGTPSGDNDKEAPLS